MNTKEITTREIEEKIIQILSRELVSIRELSRRLNVRRDLLTGYLEALKNSGILEFYKVGKANVYVVKRCKNER